MRAVAILLAAAAAAGCATAATSSRVEATLESALPGCRFERDSAMVLGRTSLALLRSLANVADDELDEDAREILHGIHRIEIVSYRAARGCVIAGAPPPVSRQLTAEGWRAVIAAAEDEGELAWVFTREGPDGGTSGMLVIALDQETLEVVRLDGDIERVLIAAIADDPSSAEELASSISAAGWPADPPAGTR